MRRGDSAAARGLAARRAALKSHSRTGRATSGADRLKGHAKRDKLEELKYLPEQLAAVRWVSVALAQ